MLQAGTWTEYRCKAEAAQVTRLEDGSQRVTDNRWATALWACLGKASGWHRQALQSGKLLLNMELRFARQHKQAERQSTCNRPLGHEGAASEPGACSQPEGACPACSEAWCRVVNKQPACRMSCMTCLSTAVHAGAGHAQTSQSFRRAHAVCRSPGHQEAAAHHTLTSSVPLLHEGA